MSIKTLKEYFKTNPVKEEIEGITFNEDGSVEIDINNCQISYKGMIALSSNSIEIYDSEIKKEKGVLTITPKDKTSHHQTKVKLIF